MTDKTTAEREAFEAWANKHGAPPVIGVYRTAAWNAWQARASLPLPGAQEAVARDGWLHENGLLYRLTDERRPSNRDEISVTMADGSRSIASRSRRALELLDVIRSSAPQPALSAGWVSVDERLPELYERVMVITTDCDDDPYATPANYNGPGKFLAAGGHRLDPVTHWQEIEAPPAGWKLPPSKPRVSHRKKGRQPLPPSPSMDGESNG